MELYVNRRVRDKAMVLGLPAERFMICFALMCMPILVVIFAPLIAILWLPWGYGVYYVGRNLDSLTRRLKYGNQFPANLKNR